MPCLGLLHWFINFVSSPAPLSYLWAHLALVLPLAAAHVVVGEAHVAPHRAHLDRDHLTLVAGIQIFYCLKKIHPKIRKHGEGPS